MELTKYKLGDVCTFINGRAYSQPELLDSGKYKVLRVGNIFDGNHWYYSDMELEEDKYCNEGDLLYSWACTFGPYIWHGPKTIYHYHIWKVKPNDSLVDKSFLYYFLNHQTKGFMGSTHGSTMIHITKENMENFEVLLPSLKDQKKIASVLSALDDKIALNKKMNQKLEAMAKRLYDYWFVQYDFPDKNGHPYKTTGGPMTYNPTLKREIPPGWEVKNVNDVTTSVRGVSYSSDDEKSKTDPNVVQILRGNNISGSRFVFDSNDVFVSSDLVAEEQKISKFDIVMAMSSGSKEHVGKSAVALYDMPHSFGAFCSKFTPNEEARYFIDCYLHSEIFIKYIRQTCSGTGINNLTNGHFDKSLFAWPTEDILKSFNEKVSAIYEQRGVIEREVTRLTALRDKLLPLLMNGQVSLRD